MAGGHRLTDSLIAASGLWPAASRVVRMCAQRRTSAPIWGKQSVITVGKAMTSQQGGGRQPAGIRDVARLAGVSVASVSFALNGQPGVADDTRRRILAAAAELGYRANPQAQALRRGRTTTYGLVIRNFSNPFFLEVLTGAEQAASRGRGHLAPARLALLGRTRAPAGPGDGGPAPGRAGHRPGRQGRVAAAVAGTAARHPGGGAERGGGGHGRRVPGVSRQRGRGRAGDAPPGRARALLRGVPVGAARPGGRPGPAAPFPAAGPRARPRSRSSCARRSRSPTCARRPGRCWPSRDAPTAIITNSDYTALGIYKTARDLVLRIGPDVSVIGHDDLPTSELLDPPLATIRLDGREMGRALMARLLGDGRSGDYVAPVELVERASLQAPPGTG